MASAADGSMPLLGCTFDPLTQEDVEKLRSLLSEELISMLSVSTSSVEEDCTPQLSNHYRNLLREFEDSIKEICGSETPFRSPLIPSEPSKSRSGISPTPVSSAYVAPIDRPDPSKAAMEAAKALRKRKLEADEARARKAATISGQHFTASGTLL